jgi:FAD/FMN-containing dehydrogenase
MLSKPIFFAPHGAAGSTSVAKQLRRELRGDVLFSRADRGRYSTDASIYQIMPLGVVVPRDQDDLLIALEIARSNRLAVLARGAGTSQCGQTVGQALVIDNSKWLNKVVHFDKEARAVTVEPGIVLDHLNAWLKPHGLWFPVDVSTAAQCTLGGMAGNNSCGSRSIEYGNMVHNVSAIDAVLADGTQGRFGRLGQMPVNGRMRDIVSGLQAIALRERDESSRARPRYCAASAATTSTSSTVKIRVLTPTMEKPTWPRYWWVRKGRSLTAGRSCWHCSPCPNTKCWVW